MRVAVLFETGRNGVAALERAMELAAAPDAELTVVVLAPQATNPRCCGPSADAYNCAVVDAATDELRQAAHLVHTRGERTRFTVLVERRDPPLPDWVAQNGVELMVVPARRRVLRAPGHPAVRRLHHVTGCDVCVVAADKGRHARAA